MAGNPAQHEDKSMVSIKINNKEMNVPSGISIVEAAHEAGIKIPTLCHLDLHDVKMVNKTASCRVCMVELVDSRNNRNKLVPACVTKVSDGMEVLTSSVRTITEEEWQLSFFYQTILTSVLLVLRIWNASFKLSQLS